MIRVCVVVMMLGLVTAMLPGCSDAGLKHPVATFMGTVTVDGQPLKNGKILFMPKGQQQSPPTQADIVDGKYRDEKVPLGAVTVMFNTTLQEQVLVSGWSVRCDGSVPGVPCCFFSRLPAFFSFET